MTPIYGADGRRCNIGLRERRLIDSVIIVEEFGLNVNNQFTIDTSITWLRGVVLG